MIDLIIELCGRPSSLQSSQDLVYFMVSVHPDFSPIKLFISLCVNMLKLEYPLGLFILA